MSSIFSRLIYFIKNSGSFSESNHIVKYFPQEKLIELEKMLGFTVNDSSLYVQALLHRSYLEEIEGEDFSNERLEFLGDSILSLVVAEFLYYKFPDKDEGFLTKVRAKLVNRNALSDAAEEIGLEKFILINQNLTNTFSRAQKTVLSDALEALFGAIYIDKGLEICSKFIKQTIIEPNTREDDYLIDENYKSQLLEYAQANKLEMPYYSVIKEEGPQHDRVFTVKVNVGETYSGVGSGKNKKSAEQNAAKSALKKILD